MELVGEEEQEVVLTLSLIFTTFYDPFLTDADKELNR